MNDWREFPDDLLDARGLIEASFNCGECMETYHVSLCRTESIIRGLPLVRCRCGYPRRALAEAAIEALREVWAVEKPRNEEPPHREHGGDSPAYRDAMRDAGRGHLLH